MRWQGVVLAGLVGTTVAISAAGAPLAPARPKGGDKGVTLLHWWTSPSELAAVNAFFPFDVDRRAADLRMLLRDGRVPPLGDPALDILLYANRPSSVIAKLIDHFWSDVTVEEGKPPGPRGRDPQVAW